MITLYEIALVMFVLQVYVLKHTYWTKCYGSSENIDSSTLEPLKVPLWVVLAMFLISLIPGGFIGVSIIFWVIWLKRFLDPEDGYRGTLYTYWRFKDKILSKPI